MKMNLHLVFPGTCREAFAFYEEVLHTKSLMLMTYGDAPGGSPVPEDSKDRVMHTAIPLGGITLMGADSAKGQPQPMGGFHVSLDSSDEAEVRRVFAALSDGGTVTMPLAPTFWSPLFGEVKDKFGVGWMVGVTGPQV